MASRVFASRLRSRLHLPLRAALLYPRAAPIPALDPPLLSLPTSLLRHLSTAARRAPTRSRTVDIGARASQFQTRCLWTYALTFSCVTGFIIIVLSNFQDQMAFYITLTDALQCFAEIRSKFWFRLGGLLLENNITHPSASSPESLLMSFEEERGEEDG